MSWKINPEDLKAIAILDRGGQKSLTDLVRDIYGIDLDEDGKEDNSDRLRKINRFKKHINYLVDDGFIQASQAKTETSTRPVTVYSLVDGMIRGKGILLIMNDDGIDVTEIGRIIKISKPDGKSAILPISV
jgi:hypothetical protein